MSDMADSCVTTDEGLHRQWITSGSMANHVRTHKELHCLHCQATPANLEPLQS